MWTQPTCLSEVQVVPSCMAPLPVPAPLCPVYYRGPPTFYRRGSYLQRLVRISRQSSCSVGAENALYMTRDALIIMK